MLIKLKEINTNDKFIELFTYTEGFGKSGFRVEINQWKENRGIHLPISQTEFQTQEEAENFIDSIE